LCIRWCVILSKIVYLPEILVHAYQNTACHNAEETSNFRTTGRIDYFNQLNLVTLNSNAHHRVEEQNKIKAIKRCEW
jgi:hypothetical protein